MAFVKVLKNKAFFKRYQVKSRRRREGKTDYFARRKMIHQDKNKYNNRKYRLIVRFTNSRIIFQVAYATMIGDKVVCQADSKELANYGIPAGHTNYAAAYAAGLLIARRTLKHFGLDQTIKGKAELDGAEYHVEEEETDQRPFKCILDVGLQRTVPGARLWGALKGAVDGGLHVPHSAKNFPGFKPGDGKGDEGEYDVEAHKDRIFGKHLQEYMEMLQEEDPTKYEAHFARFIAGDIEPDGIEDMYASAHTKIREDPTYTPKEKKGITWTREDEEDVKPSDGSATVTRNKKLTLKARKAKVAAKIKAAQERMLAEAEE
jgi:large subunit ribosomal protein L5e